MANVSRGLDLPNRLHNTAQHLYVANMPLSHALLRGLCDSYAANKKDFYFSKTRSPGWFRCVLSRQKDKLRAL
jgi:hypothetical protein